MLATAIGLQSDDQSLINVHDFITKDLLIDSGNVSFDFRTKYLILKEQNELIKTIFQKAIGDGIIDVQLKKEENHAEKRVNFSIGKDGKIQNIEEMQLPPNVQEQLRIQEELGQYKVKLIRKNAQKEKVEFDLMAHESLGTIKLFNYLGPIIDILSKGKIFIADELTESIHPKLIEFVINLFHSKETNPKNAQLIMTSHNVSLISKQLDLFRRDQIWFVDKGAENNSTLYPLTDYYTRKDADFTDYYLAGRYGAIREVEDSKK
jgi:AAA15 family ATPase/GTPase